MIDLTNYKINKGRKVLSMITPGYLAAIDHQQE